ncbi:MAG TPA: hypothetical protein VLX92_30960 [Kofleriaceae bacterium]|nr:hypothetical protein [Kofleriaceae bacterium]
MLRVLAVLCLALGCTQEYDSSKRAAPPPRVTEHAEAPPRATPDPWAPQDPPWGEVRTISLETSGLGVWRGHVCGCAWRIEVDLVRGTITATDPDGKPRVRSMDLRESGRLATMAWIARLPPLPKQSHSATDYSERLTISDGAHTFSVENAGPIEGAEPAKLVAALNVAARWPKVD